MGSNRLEHQFTIDREGQYWLIHEVRTPLKPRLPVLLRELTFLSHLGHIRLQNNELILAPGYFWNGASGVTIDTPDTYYASCVHDALYALIKQHGLPSSVRFVADQNFLRLLKEDGMSWIRRSYWYLFVRLFGWRYC